MKNLNKNYIKVIIFILIHINITCDLMMERDNAMDPKSGQFKLPEVTANFAASVTHGAARLTVNFVDQSIGSISAWEWDFNNDGIVDSTDQNPNYTYEFVGKYSVKLKVYECRGFNSNEIVKTDYIEVIIGTPLKNIIKNDFDGAICVSAADIDEDGDQDIIGTSYWEGEIIWFENIDASTWIEHKIVENFFCLWSVIPADIDGDGDFDFISAGPYSFSNGIYWWENRKGEDPAWKDNWSPHIVDDTFTGVKSINAVDIDKDGDLDIAGASYEDEYVDFTGSQENSEISWWENEDQNPGTGDGNGSSWIKHKLTGPNTGADFKGITNLSIIDADNDNDPDIAYTESNLGKIILLENRRGQSTDWKENFIEHTMDDDFDTAEDVFSADINGDGDQDVVGVSRGTWNSGIGKYKNSCVCWWENNYTETGTFNPSSWQKHTIYNDFNGGRTVIVEDIDGDSDNDIIGASSHNDTIIWWENRDNFGTEWTDHIVDRHFHTAFSLHTADIDNDGDRELLGASKGNWVDEDNYYYLSKIAWWEIIY